MQNWVRHLISNFEILPSEIIIIINEAWKHSFANVISGNKKEIAEHGWFTLD